MTRTVDWDGEAIIAIDQTLLPHEVRVLRITDVDMLISAIKSLAIRGAPALGGAGALGVALLALTEAPEAVPEKARRLAAARPTAVNLSWGVQTALGCLEQGPQAVLNAALRVLEQDEQANWKASLAAANLLRQLCARRPLRILTHCNAGRLATVGWGSALGVVRHLAEAGEIGEVLADETRPLLQGSRLTAFELAEMGVAYRLCPDSAAASAMAMGMVDAVVVGADRIAANGDVANKIGTFAVALAAARHHLPFIVVAPESTVDDDLPDGAHIPIEHRDPAEVTHFAGSMVAPQGAQAFNPAFDVTPHDLVTAIVTQDRVWQPGHTN